MKLIIAGSRTVTDYELVASAIERSGYSPSFVLSGGQRNSKLTGGVDLHGETWAIRNAIPVKIHPANWDKHDKAAGPYRNRQMGNKADALCAIWNGKSAGTKHMLNVAHDLMLPVFFVYTDGRDDWTNEAYENL